MAVLHSTNKLFLLFCCRLMCNSKTYTVKSRNQDYAEKKIEVMSVMNDDHCHRPPTSAGSYRLLVTLSAFHR